MLTVALAMLAALVVARAPGVAASRAQEAARYGYEQPLALADVGGWPRERLQAVTLVLDEVSVDRDVMTWWVFVASGEDWNPAVWPEPCCVLNLAPRAIYLLDAQASGTTAASRLTCTTCCSRGSRGSSS